MRKLLILGLVLLAGCATSTTQKQLNEVESLCVSGSLEEYESRTSEGWLKFRCR